MFGLKSLAGKPVGQMSYGEFRSILTLRALVNEPQLLLLDEPFDGLDPAAKRGFADALELLSRNGTRLIIVTHHPADLPACIRRGMLLVDGGIICQGEFEKVRSQPAMRRLFGAHA